MRIPVIGGLRRSINWIRKRFASKAAILMYHRVVEKDVDPWSLCVSPQHFAEHLAILQKHTRPISLKQLVQAHREGNIPNQAVAVTFDDGYADNLHNAKPLLEQYNIPATVFVASGAVGRKREFWWDELERIFLHPGKLPETLELNINSKTFRWVLGKAPDYGEDVCRRDCDWQEYPAIRHSLFLTLHQLLQPLSDVLVYQVMDELLAWSGKKYAEFSTNRTLSPKELLMLNQGELIEIGAHTVTHPFLSTLPESIQQDEIRQNKNTLEESLGQPVKLLAYPYGNYTVRTAAIIRKAGFDCACTIDGESVWHGSDRFLLPRIWVDNLDGEEFARLLSKIFIHDKIV